MNNSFNTTTSLPPIPKPGFYYHYKHDPEGPINNYAYEVLSVGHHTEEECRPEDVFMVVYRPLYESAFVYQLGRLCDLRPLSMFMEHVQKDGQELPRFRKIEDPDVLNQLKEMRSQMY